MDTLEYRKLKEEIEHLKIETRLEREWDITPPQLRMFSRGRYEQMQESRRLGFPSL